MFSIEWNLFEEKLQRATRIQASRIRLPDPEKI